MNENDPNEVCKVLMSGKVSQYNKVNEFEKTLSRYIGNNKLKINGSFLL